MFKINVNAGFFDVDGLRHVNNTAIPKWFELGRNAVFQIFNPNLNDYEKWNLILVRIEIDYVCQMYLMGDITINTSISKIGNSSFEVYQEAYQNNKLCAKGKSVLVHFDFQNQKSIAIPDDKRIILEKHLYKEEHHLN